MKKIINPYSGVVKIRDEPLSRRRMSAPPPAIGMSLLVSLFMIVLCSCSPSGAPSDIQLKNASYDAFLDHWGYGKENPRRSYVDTEFSVTINNKYDKTYNDDIYHIYEVSLKLNAKPQFNSRIPGIGEMEATIGVLDRGEKSYWRLMGVDGPKGDISEISVRPLVDVDEFIGRNIRAIDHAVPLYYVNEGKSEARLGDIIGPGKYIDEIATIDGERYPETIKRDSPVTVSKRDGTELRYHWLPLAAAKEKSQLLHESMSRSEVMALLGIPDASKTDTTGSNTPNPETILVWDYQFWTDGKLTTLEVSFSNSSSGWEVNRWSWWPN